MATCGVYKITNLITTECYIRFLITKDFTKNE